MRLFIAICFLFCSALCDKESELDEATNWINQILDGQDLAQSRFDTDKDSKVTKQTPAPTTSTTEEPKPIILSPTNKGKKSCATNGVADGLCVKPTSCDLEPKKIDPTTDFQLREKGCHQLQTCCPRDKVRAKPMKAQVVATKGCGWSNPGANVFRERTDSGYADYGDFPWMVALIKRSASKMWTESYLGGGSLIHPYVVMTAAHKVADLQPDEIKCRAGEWDTRTDMEIYPYQEQEVKKIVIHNEYFSLRVYNDVALLILRKPFVLEDAPHMGLACVGRSLPAPGTKCYSMGWGEDFNNATKYAVVLKKIQMPLVGAEQCENNLKNTRLGSKYVLDKSLTCAGGEEGVDTCVGDGGSSLVCPLGDTDGESVRYAVFGMVAYGVGCGLKDVPGVYVNVPEVYDWVAQQTVLEGFTKDTFVY